MEIKDIINGLKTAKRSGSDTDIPEEDEMKIPEKIEILERNLVEIKEIEERIKKKKKTIHRIDCLMAFAAGVFVTCVLSLLLYK